MSSKDRQRWLSSFSILVIPVMIYLMILPTGCTKIKMSAPLRTATEQFLISVAVRESIESLNMSPLAGYRVFIDDSGQKRIDYEYILAEFRAAVGKSGAKLVEHRADAELITEFRSDGVGIDREEFFIGIPGIPIPGFDPSTAALGGGFTTPELPMFKIVSQKGFAGASYIAYWNKQGGLYVSSGPYVGESLRRDGWLFALGPLSRGNIPPVE